MARPMESVQAQRLGTRLKRCVRISPSKCAWCASTVASSQSILAKAASIASSPTWQNVALPSTLTEHEIASNRSSRMYSDVAIFDSVKSLSQYVSKSSEINRTCSLLQGVTYAYRTVPVV